MSDHTVPSSTSKTLTHALAVIGILIVCGGFWWFVLRAIVKAVRRG